MSNKIMTDLLDTQDMGLTIALVCCGFNLVDLEKDPFGKRITFRFDGQKNIHNIAQDYWNGKLTVDAKAYWNESKNLKTRLYSL
jgi:hypothetical protein